MISTASGASKTTPFGSLFVALTGQSTVTARKSTSMHVRDADCAAASGTVDSFDSATREDGPDDAVGAAGS